MEIGKKLLADLVKIKELKEIDLALEGISNYREIRIPKRNGSCRILFEPPKPLKKLQKKILKYFLYRILVSPCCIGFRQGLSYVDNARLHNIPIHPGVKTVFRIDLKDAFPSISSGCLMNCLEKIFSKELEEREIKRVEWFQELLEIQKSGILNDFTDLLVKLTTFEGKLPQGTPTSPYLLNIVITRSGILEKICKIMSDWSRPKGWSMTIYADDIVVSTSKESIPWKIRKEIIEAVESSGIFKVNRQKISYQKSRNIAPMITGLRITAVKGERKVILPKKEIRKIRGLIYQSRQRPELKAKVEGYLAMLKPIYGDNLPKQISKPLSRITTANAELSVVS